MTAAIDLYCGRSTFGDAAYGCLAISTLTTEAADDPDFRSMLAHVVERMDRGFAGLIYAEMKDSVPEASVQFAAQHLSLMLHGLSVRARAGESRDILVELAETAVDRLVPDPASAPVM